MLKRVWVGVVGRHGDEGSSPLQVKPARTRTPRCMKKDKKKLYTIYRAFSSARGVCLSSHQPTLTDSTTTTLDTTSTPNIRPTAVRCRYKPHFDQCKWYADTKLRHTHEQIYSVRINYMVRYNCPECQPVSMALLDINDEEQKSDSRMSTIPASSSYEYDVPCQERCDRQFLAKNNSTNMPE